MHLGQIHLVVEWGQKKMFILLVLSFLFSLHQPLAQAREKLILTTFPDSDTPNIIIAQTIISEAYRRLGVDIEVKYLPGRRAVNNANNGDVDGLLFHVPNLDHAYTNLVQIKAPVFHSELVAFVKKQGFRINGWDDLKKYRIGFVRGFVLVEERTKGAQVEMFNEIDELLSMLSNGKIDVAIDTYLSGRFSIKKLGLKEIKRLEIPLESFSSFHYLHKKHEYLIPKVEEALSAMDQEGVVGDIRNKILIDLLGEN